MLNRLSAKKNLFSESDRKKMDGMKWEQIRALLGFRLGNDASECPVTFFQDTSESGESAGALATLRRMVKFYGRFAQDSFAAVPQTLQRLLGMLEDDQCTEAGVEFQSIIFKEVVKDMALLFDDPAFLAKTTMSRREEMMQIGSGGSLDGGSIAKRHEKFQRALIRVLSSDRAGADSKKRLTDGEKDPKAKEVGDRPMKVPKPQAGARAQQQRPCFLLMCAVPHAATGCSYDHAVMAYDCPKSGLLAVAEKIRYELQPLLTKVAVIAAIAKAYKFVAGDTPIVRRVKAENELK